MKLLVDPAYADDLRDHLRRYAGVTAVTAEDDALSVALDDSLPPEVARLGLDLFLLIWKATRPEVPVEIIA